MLILFQILSIILCIAMAFIATNPLICLIWSIAACISVATVVITISD